MWPDSRSRSGICAGVLADYEGGAADDAPIRPKRTKQPKEPVEE